MHSSCSSFELTSEYFPWFRTNLVILCFDYNHQKSCFSFDGQLTHIGDSNYKHYIGGMTKYHESLLTVGGGYYEARFFGNQMTEILKINENKNFSWSVVESDFEFTLGGYIYCHSLITVESSDINEEYVLLIGGHNGRQMMKDVFKFMEPGFLLDN